MPPDSNKELVKNCIQRISKSERLVQSLVPKHFDGEKLLRLAVAALSDDAKLQTCVPLTIVNSVVVAAKLGLEFNTPLGHGYLVPYYNNKIKKLCCQFIVGYRGLIHLAVQSGKVDSIYADLVYDNDELIFSQGPGAEFRHTPLLKGDRGDWYMGYCLVRHTSGLYSPVTYMRHDQIMAIKNKTNAKTRDGKIVGPWASHEEEMAKKTVSRRSLKYEPLSVEIQTAVGLEDITEAGHPQPQVVSVDMFEPENREILAGDDLPELEAGSEDELSDTAHESVFAGLERIVERVPEDKRREVVENVFGVVRLETVKKRPTDEIARGIEEIRTWLGTQQPGQGSLI